MKRTKIFVHLFFIGLMFFLILYTQKVNVITNTEETIKTEVLPKAPESSVAENKIIKVVESPKPKNTQAPKPKASPQILPTASTSNEILNIVNEYRKNNGKGSLTVEEIVCNFAKERLGELQSNYSHDGFDEAAAKTGKKSVAENIARTSRNKGGFYIVNQMWANSSGHRENMLGDYSLGCGFYDGKYAVLILAR